MLRGDLKTTPLSDLLKRLSDAKATGCVYVQPAGRRSLEASVGLREGAICNVLLPGADDAIGTRLVASRRLTPADLAEAREAQETELAAWTLAELLIHLGLADEETVHGLVLEQALASLTELCEWAAGTWRFRRRERTGPSLPTPLEIIVALEKVAERQARWLALAETIHGADAVVALAAHADGAEGDPNLEMDADGFALLCAVDGVKTVAELAGSSGFTLLEAGDKVAALVESGLVQVTHPAHEDLYDDDVAEEAAGADAGEGDDRTPHGLAAIAAAFAVDAEADYPLAPIGAPWQAPRTANGDTLADALARVSAALSEAMTEVPEAETGESDADELAISAVTISAVPISAVEVEAEVGVADDVEVDAEVEAAVVIDVEVEVEAAVVIEAAEPLAEPEGEEHLAAVITLPFAAAEPEVEAEPEIESESAEAEVQAEVQAEDQAEAEAEAEVQAEAEPEIEGDPEVEPEPEIEAEIEAEGAEAEPEIESAEAEAEVEEVSEPADESDPEPVHDIEPEPEPQQRRSRSRSSRNSPPRTSPKRRPGLRTTAGLRRPTPHGCSRSSPRRARPGPSPSPSPRPRPRRQPPRDMPPARGARTDSPTPRPCFASSAASAPRPARCRHGYRSAALPRHRHRTAASTPASARACSAAAEAGRILRRAVRPVRSPRRCRRRPVAARPQRCA